ncbi:MAG: protein translocase subunit SecD [Sphingomonadaceae bacterium]|nr:protein translocase subunit SecD [Sphingomonadaceae bacterium]
MLDFPRWKIWAVTITVTVGVLLAVPSLLPPNVRAGIPAVIPQPLIALGLDLSGGSHILLEADIESLGAQRLEAMAGRVEDAMSDQEPRIAIGGVSRSGGRISFFVRDSAQLDDAMERIRAMTTPVALTGARDWDVRNVDSMRIVVTPSEAGLEAAVDDAVEVATEVVRTRIDELGTREPTIIRQGSDRIVVQVPGLDDPEALIALLGRTAQLEFRLVCQTPADPAALAQNRAPIGCQAFPYTEEEAAQMQATHIALQRRVMVSGDQLINAQQSYDPQTNQPVVDITFDGDGTRRFAQATQQNVGKPFAMILDGEVLSAPNINEPILGGQAQISGSFSVETANDLAIALRSGQLPVQLSVVEQRTVGPDLGRESIRLGVIAGIIGSAAVLAFMFVTYGRFGIYADIALILNALLVLGAMALLGATLTLPGIAGFVLTIGAAVDANVIINERIREELRKGRRPLAAIEHGYKEAQTAIFDANITNVIAGAMLFWFGSGPVRGFAVVLMIGIVTSVFTAVSVTRMLVSLYLRRQRPQSLTI